MALVLKDGATGDTAAVNALRELKTRATTRSEMETVSENDGLAFSWSNVTYNYTALDTILLVQNTSALELHITHIDFSGDTASEVIIHCPDNVSPAGTAVVGTNLNRDSGVVAAATAKGDETDNTQGNVVWRGRMAANTVEDAEFEGSLVLANGDSVGVDFVTVGAAANVTILGYYAAKE